MSFLKRLVMKLEYEQEWHVKNPFIKVYWIRHNFEVEHDSQ